MQTAPPLRPMRRVFLLPLLIAAYVPFGRSQVSPFLSSRVHLRIVDATGAVMPGVAATIKNASAPGTVRTEVADSQGRVELRLASGAYTLEVMPPGSTTITREFFTVTPSASDLTMDITPKISPNLECTLPCSLEPEALVIETPCTDFILSPSAPPQQPRKRRFHFWHI